MPAPHRRHISSRQSKKLSYVNEVTTIVVLAAALIGLLHVPSVQEGIDEWCINIRAAQQDPSRYAKPSTFAGYSRNLWYSIFNCDSRLPGFTK